MRFTHTGDAAHRRDAPIAAAEVIAAAQQLRVGDGHSGPRLLTMLLDPALDVDALAAQIAASPALASRVMRVANSPYYGQAGQVASIGRAAQVLGLQALRGIAAAACFDSLATPGGGAAKAPDLPSFRMHSLATACAAHALAQRLAPALAGPAFVAGLLHDLGLLMQWRLRPALMAELAAAAPHDPPLHGDCAGLGTGHAECARLLLRAWGLPAALEEAVAAHADAVPALPGGAAEPSLGPPLGPSLGPSLTQLLVLGEAIARAAGHAVALDAVAASDDATASLPPDSRWAGAVADSAAALPGALAQLVSVFD